jgi:uncharacterized damage-inducible protein DinB
MSASDRAGIEDLFAYTQFSWNEIITAIADHGGDELLVRPAPGSGWPALRDCLGHMMAAYYRWLTEPVPPVPGLDREAHATLAQIADHRAKVRADFRARLDVSDDELLMVRDVNVDGEMLPYSRGELLTHLLLHERGHHGDVSTLFYQLGIEPDMRVEYRFHLLAQRGHK